MSLPVISEIRRLFVKTLTSNDKYSLRNREALPKSIQMQLPRKDKSFFKFSHHFLNFDQI